MKVKLRRIDSFLVWFLVTSRATQEYKLTANVIKPANTIKTVYPRQNAALNISRTKISALAIFRKTQYPIAFNRKSVTPDSLGIKKQKSAARSFEKCNFFFFTAFNQHGASSKSRTWDEEDWINKRLGTLSNKHIFLLHSTQSSESAAFPSNTAALINFCLSN